MVLLTNSVNVFNINLIMLEEIQVVYKPINAVWLSSHRDNLYMQYLLTLQHIDISRLQMALQSTSAAIRPSSTLSLCRLEMSHLVWFGFRATKMICCWQEKVETKEYKNWFLFRRYQKASKLPLNSNFFVTIFTW